jgi:hypothetical protein
MFLILGLIIFLLLALEISKICQVFPRKKENLSWDDCSTHCNKYGSIFDCCDCLASGEYITNNRGFNERKRKCLCEAGYNNYCYTPVTNLLLSQ